MKDVLDYLPQFRELFGRNPQLSNIKPSDWAENNVVIPGKGRLNYDFNPYCREIIDTLAPDHPARKIAVMKGSQITFSSGVIIPALGYIIAEDPHNTSFMVGNPKLVAGAVEKLDYMIQGAKLQDYLRYQIQRKKNNKSGDTDELKQFLNGYIMIWSATNPKAIAQLDLGRIFLDDFDMMKGRSRDAGAFLELVEMRAASNRYTYKLMMISTPLLKSSSNIEPAYEKGDQRRYFIQCPCCQEPIIIKWNVPAGTIINPLTGQVANGDGGMVFETNNHGQLIKSSVGYVCYMCAGFFTDKNKKQMLQEAKWTPTAVPQNDEYYSYHISSLYAPVGMFNWEFYADRWLSANPQGQPRDEYAMQVLVNTCFGETYEPVMDELKATQITGNQRGYTPGVVPEQLSIADGNGKIVMLTCACDMNGKIDDARLDYEILAHTESGATYSILAGSVGTFVYDEKNRGGITNRQPYTYEFDREYSVWSEFDKILSAMYYSDHTDPTQKKWFKVLLTGIDCGHLDTYAHAFLDRTNNPCIGLRGSADEKYQRWNRASENQAIFTQGKVRRDVYWLKVGLLKDMIADNMKLKWAEKEKQPPGFMNYPQSDGGLYQFETYFKHYEAEKRKEVEDKHGNKSYRWEKVNSAAQNHFFDCRVYNMALKEILLADMRKEYKEVMPFTWTEFAFVTLGGMF